MAYTVKPEKHLNSLELDLRGVDRLGRDLAIVINDSCLATQRPIITEHPNMLVMTPAQYRSLHGDMEEIPNSTERFWMTPEGYVCDVRVMDLDGNWIKDLSTLEVQEP
jgi:hypothetical protein